MTTDEREGEEFKGEERRMNRREDDRRFALIEEEIRQIKHAIHGNGKPGIVGILAELRVELAKLQTMNRIVAFVGGAVTVSLVGLMLTRIVQ